VLDLAKEEKIIDQKQYDEIWECNVLRWLFGDDEVAKQDLITKILK